METIPKQDCQKIGFFRKTHGVFGELVLEFEAQYDYSVEETDHFFVELEGLLVPFFVADEGIRFKAANSAIITFNGVQTEKYAKRLVGASVYLFNDEIIQEEEDFSISQFTGYLLTDSQRGEIGKIERVDDYSGNLVFTVSYKGSELLVPFNEDFLVKIDETKKVLELKIPEGLIEN